ncbi:MAG TPA: FecR domain-containing protein [Polyangia bacterium]|nr:FecR domain-containing protein [Polyangia bacterium]
MTARPDFAEIARRLLRATRPAPPPRLPVDRRRLEAAVEGALHARRRRVAGKRRLARVTMAVAATFALGLGGATLWRAQQTRLAARGPAPADARALTLLASEDGVAASRAGNEPVRLRGGMTLDAGVRLVAPPAGEVRVGSAEGTLLTLEPRADLTVAEAGATQRFALHAGAVRARVARLFAGERFVIDTSDAQVEVHGTAFRVAVVAADPRCGGGTTTRVSVTEGVVSVRAGGALARVPAGGAWPAGCAPEIATMPPVPAPVAPRERAPHRAPRAIEAPIVPAAPAPPPVVAAPAPVAKIVAASDLAAQNDLFEAAVRAKKEGDAGLAARLFGRLAAEHPTGPLAESAAVQRLRLLREDDPAEASRAARDYLARFPGGFARAEAEALATPAPTSP